MEIMVPAGKYVVAVSGGVDSMVLLHLLVQLAKQPDAELKLVVAHFDHGIRGDSAEDRKLVQQRAQLYKLPFVYDQASLGRDASEAVAREARYSFLRSVSKAVGANAIITAHHQDDVLETIIINLLRGTKSRGLSSLRSTKELLRPLLRYSKATIRSYATQHKLQWREDSTNEDEAYLRNYIRKQIMPRLDEAARTQLLEHSEKAATLNDAIHVLTEEYLAKQPEPLVLDRASFGKLPPEVSHEVLASWLRAQTEIGLTSKLIVRLSNAIREGRNGSRIDAARGYCLEIGRNTAHLLAPRR